MSTLLLARSTIQRLLPLTDCISAVEQAFVAHARGRALPAGVLGTHVANGGFHVKTCGLLGDRPYYVAKINANFPGNPSRGKPTIQGVLVLYDAVDGTPLALMDSAEVTRIRTAAATGVVAKHLAPPDAEVATIVGCGVQGRVQLEALIAVRPIRRVFAFDAIPDRAESFARELGPVLGIDVAAANDLETATRDSHVVITCTSSTNAFLVSTHVSRGSFVAAVGADHEHKQEIDPAMMAESAVVVDVLAQCVAMGDLHHAIDAGTMTERDVLGDVSDVVTGRVDRARIGDRTVVFDSTGTALEDVAAAALVYERALDDDTLPRLDLTA